MRKMYNNVYIYIFMCVCVYLSLYVFLIGCLVMVLVSLGLDKVPAKAKFVQQSHFCCGNSGVP